MKRRLALSMAVILTASSAVMSGCGNGGGAGQPAQGDAAGVQSAGSSDDGAMHLTFYYPVNVVEMRRS